MKPQPYRVVTFFCDNLIPQPLLPKGQVGSTWVPPPVGQDHLITTMNCLRELANRYGPNPVRLSRIHGWKRGTCRPYDRLRKIFEGKVDSCTADVLFKASDRAAVVFGCDFSVDRQLRCESTAAQPASDQQQPALSSPPAMRGVRRDVVPGNGSPCIIQQGCLPQRALVPNARTTTTEGRTAAAALGYSAESDLNNDSISAAVSLYAAPQDPVAPEDQKQYEEALV